MVVKGIRHFDFADSKDATRRIRGVNIFCDVPIEKDGQGFACEKLSVMSSLIETGRVVIPKLGDEIVVRYNRWGKIDSIEVLSSK